MDRRRTADGQRQTADGQRQTADGQRRTAPVSGVQTPEKKSTRERGDARDPRERQES